MMTILQWSHQRGKAKAFFHTNRSIANQIERFRTAQLNPRSYFWLSRIYSLAVEWYTTSAALLIHYKSLRLWWIRFSRHVWLLLLQSKQSPSQSCVLGQEKFDTIVRNLSFPWHKVKSTKLQLAYLPGIGLFKVHVIKMKGTIKLDSAQSWKPHVWSNMRGIQEISTLCFVVT